MTKKQYFTIKEILRELAMDSDNDMELEDNEFLPDGVAFVVKSSDEPC